jgi:hypothetical protein
MDASIPPSGMPFTANEAPRRGPLKSRRSRAVALAVVVALAFGVAGFAISASLSSGPSTPTAATVTPATGSPGPQRGPGSRIVGRFAGRFGTVRSVSASGFVFAPQTGSNVTVRVSSTTVYVDPGVTNPSLVDVKVGASVSVAGTTSSGVLDATRVMIGTPGGGRGFGGGFGGQRPVAFGTVKSVAANSFVVSSRGTTLTVNVTSSTTYRDPSASSASFADVKPGAIVVVLGTSATTGSVSATSVLIGGFGGRGGGFGGSAAGGTTS